MSARLATLEGECVKSAVHSALNETINESTSRLKEVSRQVKELQAENQQLENSASQFGAQPSDIESIVGPTGVPQQTQGTADSSNQSISPKPI
ncbi:hypothetical protein C0J52_22750 [Blattella germanica]|nr:hypothetical protein C0J52_22750 [Blattella germanica]